MGRAVAGGDWELMRGGGSILLLILLLVRVRLRPASSLVRFFFCAVKMYGFNSGIALVGGGGDAANSSYRGGCNRS